MRTIFWVGVFSSCIVATHALADADQPMGELSISTGTISTGSILQATINSDPPAGAAYKKGDILKASTISSGTVVAGNLKIPQTFNAVSGTVTSVTEGELSGANITGAKVSAGLINGQVSWEPLDKIAQDQPPLRRTNMKESSGVQLKLDILSHSSEVTPYRESLSPNPRPRR
jgi:hypothetical protein